MITCLLLPHPNSNVSEALAKVSSKPYWPFYLSVSMTYYYFSLLPVWVFVLPFPCAYGDCGRASDESTGSVREWRSGEGQSLCEVNQSFCTLLCFTSSSANIFLSNSTSESLLFLTHTHTHGVTQCNKSECVELLSCSTCVGCVRSN